VPGAAALADVPQRLPLRRAAARARAGYGAERGEATTGGLVAALAAQVGRPLALRVRRPREPGELALQVTASEAQP
jgi:hypothetical protein